MDSLPLNSSGKIDKRALPSPDASLAQTEFIAPENEWQQQLSDIWKDILGLENVGITDNFFNLGGTSIKAMQIVSKLETCNIELNIKDVFQFPSIKQLYTNVYQVKLINEKIQSEKESLVSDLKNNIGDLSLDGFIQFVKRQYDTISLINSQKHEAEYPLTGMHKINLLMGNQNIISSIPFNFHIDKDAFNEAINSVIRFQEVFRSTFNAIEDNYFWKVYPLKDGIEVPYLDLSGYKRDIQKNIISKINNNLVETKFTELNGVLYYMYLVKHGDAQFSLELVMSHLIMDAMSINIVRNNIIQYHQSIVDKKEIDGSDIKSYGLYIDLVNQSLEKKSAIEFQQEFEIDKICSYVDEANKTIIDNYFADIHEEAAQNEYQHATQLERVDIDINEIGKDNLWEVSLLAYCNLLNQLFQTEALPIFMVSFGRKYGEETFFNTVGEFLDLIPVLVKYKEETPAQIINSLNSKLAYSESAQLNILNSLMSNNINDKNWQEIGTSFSSLFKTKKLSFNTYNFLGEFAEEDFNHFAQNEDILLKDRAYSSTTYINFSVIYTKNTLRFTIKTPFTIKEDILEMVFSVKELRKIKQGFLKSEQI